MVIETTLIKIQNFFFIVFGFLPDIPSFPTDLLSSLNYFTDIIFSNLSILNIFIRINTIKIAIPILIAIINLDKIYSIILWILNKIPFIDLD